MKNFLKKLVGLDKEEARIAEEHARIAEQKVEIEEADLALLKKKDPKAYATRKGESWVSVIDVKVNKENVRNGFFELDWNELFILELRRAGYGEEGDLEEEIVDRWFRDVVYQMLDDEGLDTTRGAGYINVVPIAKGKSEVS